MKRMQIALLCLAAIFSIGVMTASGASAVEPEWLVLFKCAKVEKGLWFESVGENCKKFIGFLTGEWEPEAMTGLTVSAGEVVDFTSLSGVKLLTSKVIGVERVVECSEGKNTGETRDSKHLLVQITYTGCKVVGGGECLTTGTGELPGVIFTKPLYGWLWTIKETGTKEAGVFFTASEGEIFSTFECEFGTPLGKKVVEVLSTPKTSYELPNGTFPNGKCLAAKIQPINGGPLGLGELIVEEEVGKQKIKLVTYDGHTFECELEIDLSGVGGPFKAWEVELTPDDIVFAEPVEVLL
jgi:hypothetical protein